LTAKIKRKLLWEATVLYGDIRLFFPDVIGGGITIMKAASMVAFCLKKKYQGVIECTKIFR